MDPIKIPTISGVFLGLIIKGLYHFLYMTELATHQASQRLDIDLLVVDNIDELKNFKAPAALRRGHKPLPDSVDVSLSCYAGNGQQKYGMNLGVALLKPSRDTLEKMLVVVKSRDRTHQATNGPEQDFLILAFDFSS